jgi:2-keto-3-deoxy-L-fuconate dehydrogenase
MRSLQNRLGNKTVLVTAAAAGIGRASAIRMAEEGANVIATDIDGPGLASLKAQAGVQVRKLDATDLEQIARAVKEIGAVDVLVNCVGYVATGDVLSSSRSDWDRSLTINVTSCFEMIRGFLPGMLDRGAGSIVNIASIVSSLKSAPLRCCYATTKAALIGLTKSVACDFVGRGVRCNAVCPGTVDTPSLQGRLHATGDYDKARREFEARQPMKRLGHVDEISSLVAFLASDEAGFVTGQTYAVDGGWSM